MIDITIYDIAREAGVSPSTVSRVLTNKNCVSAKKRQVVEKTIKKHNYRPNAAAQSLNIGTRIIGLMLPDIRNPYYAALAVECEKAASKMGYTVLLCNMFNDSSIEVDHMEKFYSHRVEAIIQIGRQTQKVNPDPAYVEHVKTISRAIPFITNGKLEGVDHYSVRINNAMSLKLVMDYLYSLGHREIAFTGGEKCWLSTLEKWEEYMRLLALYKLKYRKEFVREGEYSDTAGYECMKQMLKQKKIPGAVIAINDEFALGVILAAQDNGYSVPGDISVVSFDNTYLTRLSRPTMTTVDYNYPLFGKTLVDTAIQAAWKKTPAKEILIEPVLVVRESCCKPKKKSG